MESGHEGWRRQGATGREHTGLPQWQVSAVRQPSTHRSLPGLRPRHSTPTHHDISTSRHLSIQSSTQHSLRPLHRARAFRMGLIDTQHDDTTTKAHDCTGQDTGNDRAKKGPHRALGIRGRRFLTRDGTGWDRKRIYPLWYLLLPSAFRVWDLALRMQGRRSFHGVVFPLVCCCLLLAALCAGTRLLDTDC